MGNSNKLVDRRCNLMRWLSEYTREHCMDPVHAQHVTDIALFLFNELSAIHGYAENERRILETAAMLHDLGVSRGDDENHHKISRDLILKLEVPELDVSDRFLAAQIARFHRKSEPDAKKHRSYQSLSFENQRCVCWLSGILRVADGLDRTHLGLVTHLSVELDEECCAIHIDSPRAVCELEGAIRKCGLLQEMLKRRLTISIEIQETI